MGAGENDPRGRLLAGLADDPPLRWAAVDLRGPLREACDLLDLSPVAAGALGRCLAGAVLLQRMSVKAPSRLILAVSGSGPLRRIMAEVDESGSIRGMVSHPHIEVPLSGPTNLGVGRAIGTGLLRVMREGRRGSYQSHVEIQAGQIGDALTRFLEQSEQTRSAILLGVLAESSGIAGAGGLMIEALPGAHDEALSRIEKRIATLPSVGRALARDGPEGLVAEVLRDSAYRLGERRSISYGCRCSEQSIRGYLANLSPNEREELRESTGELVSECVFCGKRYRFGDDELPS